MGVDLRVNKRQTDKGPRMDYVCPAAEAEGRWFILNWKRLSDAGRPNIVSRVCAIVAAFTLVLPWFVRQTYSFRNPNPLIEINFAVPYQYYILLELAGEVFVDAGGYHMPYVLTFAALVFVIGTLIAFFTPFGGVVQAGSISAMTIYLVLNDFMLIDSIIVKAEYHPGIGFYIASLAASVTILSLSPRATGMILKLFRTLRSKFKPQAQES